MLTNYSNSSICQPFGTRNLLDKIEDLTKSKNYCNYNDLPHKQKQMALALLEPYPFDYENVKINKIFDLSKNLRCTWDRSYRKVNLDASSSTNWES